MRHAPELDGPVDDRKVPDIDRYRRLNGRNHHGLSSGVYAPTAATMILDAEFQQHRSQTDFRSRNRGERLAPLAIDGNRDPSAPDETRLGIDRMLAGLMLDRLRIGFGCGDQSLERAGRHIKRPDVNGDVVDRQREYRFHRLDLIEDV